MINPPPLHNNLLRLNMKRKHHDYFNYQNYRGRDQEIGNITIKTEVVSAFHKKIKIKSYFNRIYTHKYIYIYHEIKNR